MSFVFHLRPQFPKAEITSLAMRSNSNEEDELLSEIGRRSYAAGFYTRDDFMVMCGSNRAGRVTYCDLNSIDAIDRMTRITFTTGSERQRISSLMQLSGVSWCTASVFMNFTFGDSYPMLTPGAMWSLGCDNRPGLNFDFWTAYVEACRDLASECHVRLRILVAALSQFAMEHKPS